MATFYNQATLSYNGMTTTSNITAGEILDVLTVTKTAVIDEYSSGDTVTYVVSIVNTSGIPFSGLTVTDTLGEFTDNARPLTPLDYTDGSLLYYINGILQTAPAITAGPPLTITGITVPAGGSVLLIYAVSVNRFAPLEPEEVITNEVSVSGDELAAPITAEETIRAAVTPILAITKSLSPTSVPENGQITYTFVLENYGSRAADTDDRVAVTDTFNPILQNITVTLNGDLWSESGNYTYNEATGLFSTIPGQLTVPAATFLRDPVTGTVSVTPGVTIVTVTGTL